VNKFYGGIVCKPAGNVRRQISGISAEDSSDTPHASTYTPEEVRMADAYWREQMADAEPSTDYRSL